MATEYLPLGEAAPLAVVCQTCGAVVYGLDADKEKHSDFHQRVKVHEPIRTPDSVFPETPAVHPASCPWDWDRFLNQSVQVLDELGAPTVVGLVTRVQHPDGCPERGHVLHMDVQGQAHIYHVGPGVYSVRVT